MADILARIRSLDKIIDYANVNDEVASSLHFLQQKIAGKLDEVGFDASTLGIAADGQEGISGGIQPIKSYNRGTRNLNYTYDQDSPVIKTIQNTSRLRKRHSYTAEEKRFKCALCDYRAHRKDMVQSHLKMHSEDRPFPCHICDYRSKDNSSLQKHIRRHMGEKPFKCSICNGKFSESSALTTHLRHHTGEKPYKCSLCPYSAAQSGSVRIHHRIIHSKEKPYQCRFCNFKASLQGNLRVHERSHTGEKPYLCTLCNMKFARKDRLENHLIQNHGGGVSAAVALKSNSCNLCDNGITHEDATDAYKCNQCDFVATKCYELHDHVKSHAYEMENPEVLHTVIL